MDPVEVGARNVQSSRHRPRRQQEAVVAEAAARFAEQQLAGLQVDPAHACRSEELDPVSLVEGPVVDEGRLAGLAAQVILRERWALIWPVRLLPDQDEAAIEPLGAQCRRRPGAGQAGADDCECLGTLGHLFLSGLGVCREVPQGRERRHAHGSYVGGRG